MATSPTQLSLRECRKRGWAVDIAEKWVAEPAPGHRKDLFGFIDLVVFDGLLGTLYVQATSSSNVSARVTKIQTVCAVVLDRCLRGGNRVEVWGWSQPKGPGTQYELERRAVTSVTDTKQLWRPPRRRARRNQPEHEQLVLSPQR